LAGCVGELVEQGRCLALRGAARGTRPGHLLTFQPLAATLPSPPSYRLRLPFPRCASLRSLAIYRWNRTSSRYPHFSVAMAVLPLVVASPSSSVAGANEPTGAAIYQQKCARCHGKSGEGAKAYPTPLVGNRSLAQLTRYIAKSMPEDAPGTCTGAAA